MSPQETVERALAASTADGCIVRVVERSEANLRWANSTMTTNGEMRSRHVAVVSVVDHAEGTACGVVEHSAPGAYGSSAATADVIEDLVRRSERAAREGRPADDAAPLVEPLDDHPGRADWDAEPDTTSMDVFASVAPALGEAFARSRVADQRLFGFAEHIVESVYLGTSTGLRLRHDQPTGQLRLNAKSADFGRSAWAGAATRTFTDVDVTAMDAELTRRLGWARRRIELDAGRYQTILPPTAVADLLALVYYFVFDARDAEEGRSVFSRPGGGSRIGDRLSELPITVRSDPAEPGLQCAPFVHTSASARVATSSIFDSGFPVGAVDWVRDGVLRELARTRNWAARTSVAPAPMVDNLIMEVPGATATERELIAGTDRGLLLTCLSYVRPVDLPTALVTGLTRDGVYLVERGEVVGAVNNFRFNESPVSLLGRITEVGRTEQCFGRDISTFFTRTATPFVRVPDFNMSTVSRAS